MSIEYNQSLLASISSSNPDINAATLEIKQLTEMCMSSQITKEEYIELCEDVQRKVNIQANMAELEAMERLNIAINGLISIAKII
jgi:UDP-N-acetyl-D-mannosaminuronate dehydrogenase|tara:strand:- start:60 stop:314 length:255 start_codon:yes stop_codon:yes gene_type:complete